jgi:hypothetical protein
LSTSSIFLEIRKHNELLSYKNNSSGLGAFWLILKGYVHHPMIRTGKIKNSGFYSTSLQETSILSLIFQGNFQRAAKLFFYRVGKLKHNFLNWENSLLCKHIKNKQNARIINQVPYQKFSYDFVYAPLWY